MTLYISSFKIKIFLYMKLELFKEAKNIPEKYLPSLVDAEIECWWSEPFSEFRICKNNSCKAVFSIEDVYWCVEEYQKVRDRWELNNDFCCEECWDDTEYVYEKDEFLGVVKEYIQWTVSSILLLNNVDSIRWFWIIAKKQLFDLINIELNTRPWSYDKLLLLNSLSKNIFWENSAWNNEIIYFNHLFVWEELRNDRFWWLIMQKMFKFVKYYKDIPSIIETLKWSNVYNYMKRFWFKDSIEDKYWYVVMYLDKNNCSFRNMLNSLHNSKNQIILPDSSVQKFSNSFERLFYN